MAALRILESGVIAQATLTKIHRQRIPKLRAAIEDLSNGRTTEVLRKIGQLFAPLNAMMLFGVSRND
jgi:hypothetical protein